MLATIDYVIIVVYLLGVVAFGAWIGRRQSTQTDYFLGGRDLPWWAVCFSVIATETSTLTVIGTPAIAYGGALTFLQLTAGFLIGRIVVSWLMLPRYFAGEQETAYAYLESRFGGSMRVTASITFLITRLLADGVRLFATAIPIRVIALAAGYDVSYFAIVAGVAVLTAAYTMIGGLKAVVWVDVVQMGIYVGGGLIAIIVMWAAAGPDTWSSLADAGKLTVVDLGGSWTAILTSPYALPTALLGGAVFSMASHGADQLVVQRLLACRSLGDGRKALIGSGIGVILQFALFLGVGLLLWVHYGGATPAELGLSRGDEIFPRFIIEGLPAGISGLLLAGILAAAMSTLSSSLNALAGSTWFDLYRRIKRKEPPTAEHALRTSRWLTVMWAAVFVTFASLFQNLQNPVVELGLSIASFTYGGLLGAFLLGLAVPRARQIHALVAFGITIVGTIVLISAVWLDPATGEWLFAWRPDGATRSELGIVPIAWPLYTVIGSGGMVAVGAFLSLLFPSRSSSSV
ncbi:sodium:solute symporter [soil metagenome]